MRSQLKADLLGTRAVSPAKGMVQCPFCALVYKPTDQEHLISGICDECWPDERELDEEDIDYGDDDDKPF